ncbi:TldD/PmbA family protein [Candidatus Woesearchaeota archaeon]|nr:TldD/PmbA family protein [Candidatus Woesearchaeota archaeon]
MEILDYLMKELKNKVDDAVLTFVSGESTQIKFANNVVVNTSLDEYTHIGVFAVKDKKIIATNLKDLALNGSEGIVSPQVKKGINETAAKLVKYFKMIQPKEDYNGINDKKYRYKEVPETYDPKIKDVNGVDFVEKGINAAMKEGARRTNGTFETHDVKEYVLTSEGIEYSNKNTEIYFTIRSFVDEDESGHVDKASCITKGFDTEKIGKKSGEIASNAKNPVNGKRGKYDIILSPLSFAPILNSIGESASIFSVESGLSFFTDSLNKKIGSNKISIYDDGRLRNGIGSTKVDHEGVPTRRTPILEKGVHRNYLHNYSTAKKYNVQNAGNAGLISPEPWNIVVDNGDYELDEMIKSVKRGLYVTNVWYTRFSNYHTGDFSTIPRDGCFLIKNGEIKESWKGVRISENILHILKNVAKVGKNTEHLRSWEAPIPIKSPSILIKNCKVTVPTK